METVLAAWHNAAKATARPNEEISLTHKEHPFTQYKVLANVITTVT
jgi:hypothetical protein